MGMRTDAKASVALFVTAIRDGVVTVGAGGMAASGVRPRCAKSSHKTYEKILKEM